jgi:hypothetical protein
MCHYRHKLCDLTQLGCKLRFPRIDNSDSKNNKLSVPPAVVMVVLVLAVAVAVAVLVEETKNRVPNPSQALFPFRCRVADDCLNVPCYHHCFIHTQLTPVLSRCCNFRGACVLQGYRCRCRIYRRDKGGCICLQQRSGYHQHNRHSHTHATLHPASSDGPAAGKRSRSSSRGQRWRRYRRGLHRATRCSSPRRFRARYSWGGRYFHRHCRQHSYAALNCHYHDRRNQSDCSTFSRTECRTERRTECRTEWRAHHCCDNICIAAHTGSETIIIAQLRRGIQHEHSTDACDQLRQGRGHRHAISQRATVRRKAQPRGCCGTPRVG